LNLTITIDDELLRRARIRALEQGTSVNQVVREFLEGFAGGDVERQARARLIEMAHVSKASSGTPGRTWTRESLYDDRLGNRQPDSVNEPR
jgi:plasmid stability protein